MEKNSISDEIQAGWWSHARMQPIIFHGSGNGHGISVEQIEIALEL